MISKIKQLDKILEDPNLWHDPDLAAKRSRERGSIASRLKSVRQLENELAEHVGMAELGREENDFQVESVCCFVPFCLLPFAPSFLVIVFSFFYLLQVLRCIMHVHFSSSSL